MHTENSNPWGQAEADALLADSLTHRRDHVEYEACIILWGTAILVRTVVRGLFEELIEKIPIGAVNLNTIKAPTLDRVARRRSIQPHVLCDLVLRQRAWMWWMITVFLLV
jgi:hypothetical protein